MSAGHHTMVVDDSTHPESSAGQSTDLIAREKLDTSLFAWPGHVQQMKGDLTAWYLPGDSSTGCVDGCCIHSPSYF